MATRAKPSYYGTRTLSKKFNAKCEANQPLVNKLADKHDKTGSSNFGYTLKRAAESICKETVPITSFEQVISLKCVGPTIAKMLGFSKSFVEKDDTKQKGRGKKKAGQNASSGGSDPDSPSSVSTSNSKVSARGQKRKLKQSKATTLAPIKEKASKKELAYQKAVEESESWKGKRLKWRLVLLIDQRERKAEHYASKIEQCGIPTEIRSLPIGDMCWIAQGFDESGTDSEIQAELMLGTIIERKEVSDLKASLFGTRYTEQQLRLKDSGQPQVIFLVEGDTRKDLYRCPAETLHSTMWAIRIEKQNQVIQTAHAEETVNTLRRMHRRMLQRTFPSAFYSEALPAFEGPDVSGPRGRRQRDSFGEQRRKRRRRLESLHGLVFDEEPIPMAGMPRFVTYQELKARVQRDREAGRRTVGSIHQGMLKQVATISDTKILPICSVYPTANALLKAYNNVPSQPDGKHLLEKLDISANSVNVKSRTLGPRSAEEMYIAYGIDGSRRDSIDSTSSTAGAAAAAAADDDDAHQTLNEVRMQPEMLDSIGTTGRLSASGADAIRRAVDSGHMRAEIQHQEDSDVQTALTESLSPTHNDYSRKPPPSNLPTKTLYSTKQASSFEKKRTTARAGAKSKPSQANVLDVVDLLSSDDEQDLPLDVAFQRPAKRRCSSPSLGDSSPETKFPGIGLQPSKAASKPRAASFLSADSSDDGLHEMLQGISKKKPAKSQTVIEID